jgi:pSer/pThr/pTyr-binding forkhead associated (FHA) protein
MTPPTTAVRPAPFPRRPSHAPPRARVVIGRHADNDFVIDDRTVSRQHAAIHREGRRWILEDLASTNGTRVNGERVARRAPIKPGDEIGFGAATARFDPDERRLFSELRVEEPTGV